MPEQEQKPKVRLEIAAGAWVTTYYTNGTHETRRTSMRQWVTAHHNAKKGRYEWAVAVGLESWVPTQLRYTVKAGSPKVEVLGPG